jgi:hypothetical protein
MHGNVNEWCWDLYGAYDLKAVQDPTGPSSGTRHVYRGGGWNDFAKNMRSAYRAAGPEDMHSYNLGLRLVRNADSSRTGSAAAGEANLQTEAGGKMRRLLDMYLEQQIDFGTYEDKKKGDDYKPPRRNSKSKKLSSQPTDDSSKLSQQATDVARRDGCSTFQGKHFESECQS